MHAFYPQTGPTAKNAGRSRRRTLNELKGLKDSLIDEVRFNCDVSDARYWGYFSICGLLMSLRVLYLTVNDLEPWAQIDREAISKWITQKEARWEELEDENFRDLNIHGKSYDPFDVIAINRVLNDEGLVYGAGYGLFNKPSFFLADLHSYSKTHSCSVYLAKKEYIRDLFTSPGMLQGKQIFLRLEPLKVLLWDRFLELKAKSSHSLEYAFLQYGFSADQAVDEEFKRRFEELTRRYSDIVLYHELGEVMEEVPDWSEMLFEVDTKDAEFFLRAIEDLISDASDYGPLKWTVENRDKGGLSLRIALIDRYKAKLHLEIKGAFEEFMRNEDWAVIEEARKTVYARLTLLRDELLEAYRSKRDKDELIRKVIEIQSRLQ